MTTPRAHMGINDQAALWAVKFNVGKMRNSVDDCSRWLVSVWPDIHEDAQSCIQRYVEEIFRRDDAARANGNFSGLPLGMDIDRASWERVRKLWRGEA